MTDDPDSNDESKDGMEKFIGRLSDDFGRLAKSAQQGPSKSDLQAKLFRAVKANKPDDVKKLIEAGADVNAYDVMGQTALHAAAIKGAVKSAQILIEAGADVLRGTEKDPAHAPLVDAVGFNKPEMVEFLARHGGYAQGTKINGWSVLHTACLNRKNLAVAALLRAGADPNEMTENGATPLLIAVKQGNIELVEALLDVPAVIESMNAHFVKTDDLKRPAFQLAIDFGRLPVVAAMIKKGADVNALNSDGKPPLLRAIEEKNVEMVRFLADSGADLSRVYGVHGTALMYACQTNDLDDAMRAKMIDLLIGLGADPDVPSPQNHGMTPLQEMACFIGPQESLKALLRYPVDKEWKDVDGSTALIHAVVSLGDSRNISLLLAAGANPDGRHAHDASTALICAAKTRDTKYVQALLDGGANPSLYDGHGKSALSYARENKDSQMIALLEEALAARQKPSTKHSWDL